MIPIHWGTFELGDDGESEAVDTVRAAVASLPARCRPHLVILRNGESATLPPLDDSDSLTLSTICTRSQ
jgi:hypothetical protein